MLGIYIRIYSNVSGYLYGYNKNMALNPTQITKVILKL